MKPERGAVWLVDLSPVKGHEQAGMGLALILSVDMFNRGAADLVVVVPLTTVDKAIPLHVQINPPEGGLRETSFAKCEDVRSISKIGLVKRYGNITTETMSVIEDRIRILLGL